MQRGQWAAWKRLCRGGGSGKTAKDAGALEQREMEGGSQERDSGARGAHSRLTGADGKKIAWQRLFNVTAYRHNTD